MALVIGIFPVNVRGDNPRICLTLAVGMTATTTLSYRIEDAEEVIRTCTHNMPDGWAMAGTVRETKDWRMVVFTEQWWETENIIAHVQSIITDNLLAIERFHAGN